MRHPALVFACGALALAACGPKVETDGAPATSAPALQWVTVAQTGEGGAILYDPAQTKMDPARKLVDVVVRIRHPYLEGWARELPQGYAGEIVFQTEQATLRLDCSARNMGVVSREALGPDEEVLDRRASPEPVTLAPITPGGVAEAVLPRVCAPPAP